MNRDECEHGSLRRSCEICELKAIIECQAKQLARHKEDAEARAKVIADCKELLAEQGKRLREKVAETSYLKAELDEIKAELVSAAPPYYHKWLEQQKEIATLRQTITVLRDALKYGEER